MKFKKLLIKIVKRTMITIIILGVVLTVATWLFMQRADFGAIPTGARLERMKKSPHFRNGHFENLSPTPDLTEGATLYSVMKEFIFGKDKRNKPVDSLPSAKIDLKHLSPDKDMLVWFGHSSYFIQVNGKRILVDPIFSGHASPVNFTTRSYKGSDVYTADDMPEIDYVLISHDHWDHLDYETMMKLQPKVRHIVCGLGVGAHFEHWGFDTAKVHERDWDESVKLEDSLEIHVTPARHFSGRGFTRNMSLWVSYVVISGETRIYAGGDSGYDKHFASIGEQFGPFDLVILECGQYNKSWKYIHMMPEQVVQAAIDLKAHKLMPVHWSKFSLSLHAWDESILWVTKAGKEQNFPLVTPLIGEEVDLLQSREYASWWEKVH